MLRGGPGIDVDEVGGLLAAEDVLAGLALDIDLGVHVDGLAVLVEDGVGGVVRLLDGVDEAALREALVLHLVYDLLGLFLEVYGQGVLAGVAAHDKGAEGGYLLPGGV